MTATVPPPAPTTESGPIDPRIRARRVAVQRELGRRRLRILVAVAVAVVAAGSVYLLVESPILDVDAISVEGATNVRPDAVREAAGVEHGEALLRIDLDAVARRVETLPWVADARVSRDLPGTLRVVVTERVPRAFVRRDDGASTLVGADGTVLDVVLVPPPALVEIVGVRRAPAPGSLLSPPGAVGALDALPAALVERVAVLDLGEGGDVALRLRDGGAVQLCGLDDLAAKGAAALAVLERIGSAPLDYVNVCVPSAPVARTGR